MFGTVRHVVRITSFPKPGSYVHQFVLGFRSDYLTDVQGLLAEIRVGSEAVHLEPLDRSAIVEAIEAEDHKALLQWAKQAVAILRKHIKVEDKFFNAVQQKGITPTVARQINLKLEEYNRAVG